MEKNTLTEATLFALSYFNYTDVRSLVESVLKYNVETYPDQIVVVLKQRNVSFNELYEDVQNVSQSLIDAKIETEKLVGLKIVSPYTHLVLFLSLLRLGIPQTALIPFEHETSQAQISSELAISLIIEDVGGDLGSEGVRLRFKRPKVIPSAQVNYPDDTAVVFFSSGTTGKKKIIALSVAVLADQIKRDLYVCPYERQQRFYSYTSLEYPFTRRRALAALVSGCALVIPPEKTRDLFTFCRQFSVNHLQLTVSQAVNLLLLPEEKSPECKQLPEMKSLVLASSIISQAVREYIKTHVTKNLYISYGTNEFGNIAEATPEEVRDVPGTVGRLNPGVSLRLVDKKDKLGGTDASGRIHVKAEHMISGYINDPASSIKSFAQGGYYPGDIGVLVDQQLIFQGREDDMMIFSGVNIYPRELESVLESHPEVLESAVFPLDIGLHTGIPHAAVATRNGLSETVLMEWCKKHLGWKSPHRIMFMKALPRNRSGKVKKLKLKSEIYERYYRN